MSKYPNEYAAWRVSFQSDRQAAEQAFDGLIESAHEVNHLDIELRECQRKLEHARTGALKLSALLQRYEGHIDMNRQVSTIRGFLDTLGTQTGRFSTRGQDK